jgi:hypothetical protein
MTESTVHVFLNICISLKTIEEARRCLMKSKNKDHDHKAFMKECLKSLDGEVESIIYNGLQKGDTNHPKRTTALCACVHCKN